MPHVIPTAKDIIQVKIRGTAGFEHEHYITAEIVSPQPSTTMPPTGDSDGRATIVYGNDTSAIGIAYDLWTIRVPGEPELTGTINIEKYQWDHKQGRWLPKEAPVHAAPKPIPGRALPGVEDLELAAFRDSPSPRTAGKAR